MSARTKAEDKILRDAVYEAGRRIQEERRESRSPFLNEDARRIVRDISVATRKPLPEQLDALIRPLASVYPFPMRDDQINKVLFGLRDFASTLQ